MNEDQQLIPFNVQNVQFGWNDRRLQRATSKIPGHDIGICPFGL